jgi:hypothetical protein
MKDSDKERTKLSATFLSNFGLAIVVAGFVAPGAAWSFRSATAPQPDSFAIVLSFVWLFDGIRHTFRGKAPLAKVGPMTVLEIYLLFVLPLLALGISGIVYFAASRDGRSSQAPSE